MPKHKNEGEIADIHFVKILTGPDNLNDYRYLGYIKNNIYQHGHKKSKISAEAASNRGFMWFWNKMFKHNEPMPEFLEVWHEGRCGMCNRPLTEPESIAQGLGPVCRAKLP